MWSYDGGDLTLGVILILKMEVILNLRRSKTGGALQLEVQSKIVNA